MARLLYGTPFTRVLTQDLRVRTQALADAGVHPCLALIRAGNRTDSLSYERSIEKRAEKIGFSINKFILPSTATQEELLATIEQVNGDETLCAELLLRPLPPQLDEQAACEALCVAKDVDCATPGSLAGVFMQTELGYPPCTAEAVVRLLEYYEVPLSGANVAVVGRSLVVGRPVAMLLQHKDATVTMCHTKTRNLAARCREADIIVAAAGHARTIRANMVRAEQTIVDVGTNWDSARQGFVGDVAFDEVEPLVAAITPVPKGVGALTTTILAEHVVRAAEHAAHGN